MELCNLQNGAEILVDDFDPEAHAQQTLAQKAAEAKNHAACMLNQAKVRLCILNPSMSRHSLCVCGTKPVIQ